MNPDWQKEQDKEFEKREFSEPFKDLMAEMKPVARGIIVNEFDSILDYIHHREALLIERVVGEVHKLVQDKIVGGGYDFYCEDDGECFGECTRSKDIARKEILTALQDLLASKDNKKTPPVKEG